MKKFKDLYKNIEEAAEGIEGYPPGFNTGAGEKRRVDGDSFGGFRVGEGNTLSRINAFLNKYLAGSYLAGDHKLALRELRVRLNHIGLDFDSEKEIVEGENRIKVKLHGNTFGTTPTTDLMKGFDHGEDLPSLTLMLNYNHDKNTEMCYMNGKIMLDNSVNENSITTDEIKDNINEGNKTSKRQKRINNVKKIMKKKMGEGTVVYEEKKNLNEFWPIVVAAGRALLPAIGRAVVSGVAGAAANKFLSPTQPSSSSSNTTIEKLPPTTDLPYSMSGVSRIGKYGSSKGKYSIQKNKSGGRSSVHSSDVQEMNGLGTLGVAPKGQKFLDILRTNAEKISKNLNKKGLNPVENPLGMSINNEEKISIKESKDEPRVIEHYIMRNKDIKDKVLVPVYNTLKKLKEKNKYNRDEAAKHLFYVVNYAIRKINSSGKKVTLSQIEKARVVNDLVRNFEKSIK